MDDALRAAVDTLAASITAKQHELAEMKRAANVFCRAAGIDPLYPEEQSESSTATTAKMRPDEYYGRPFNTAARDYLKRRGHAVSGEDVLAGLEQGNFDFDALGWKKETRLRAVASNLAKNTTVFHRMPNGLFGLLEWYPDAADRKKVGRKNASEKEGEESAEENETVSE